MKRLLYIFGEPGTGKITVARILQERLGWRLFWLHDLDPVCAIVGRYPLPRLMDRISLAVLGEMMDAGEDIIYVRPSRDRQTVEKVLKLAEATRYRSYLVRLWAPKSIMTERVSARPPSQFRVADGADLAEYLNGRPSSSALLPALLVRTNERTPEQVADEVQQYISGEGYGNCKSESCGIGREAPEQAGRLQP